MAGTSPAIYKMGTVAIPLIGKARSTRGVEDLDGVGVELEARGGDQVVELLQAGRAGDRRGDRGPGDQPGERHLRRRGVDAPATVVERLQDARGRAR